MKYSAIQGSVGMFTGFRRRGCPANRSGWIFPGRFGAAVGTEHHRCRTEEYQVDGIQLYVPGSVRSLIQAKHRGVDVKVVLDWKANNAKGSAGAAAMNLLVNAGIPVRTVSQFKIMHDKVIITDGRNVETGSFNFSRAAARSNSENALVIRDYPALAATYLQHWQSRWEMGTDWELEY
ncbi:Phospholipase D precursor [Raoultella terrigena]|uniref:phospholipase D n=1 Tax=Raoultella terrigena TaxID=577 RepID=A0A4V6YW80_RAOTE|nr:Phospholipase D precursor [Raoultella terrigena]